MRKKILRLLPLAAVLLSASCTDSQYNLSDIDTESRFVAQGLVIPLNLDPVQLDAVISINDGDDIQKEAGTGNYYFKKESTQDFSSNDVYVEKITIVKPADISESVVLDIALSDDIMNKIEQYASNKTIGQILGDPALSSSIGITPETEVYRIEVDDYKEFNLNATGIDQRITKLGELGFDPLTLSINVKLDGLKNLVSTVNISDLEISLPAGLTVTDNDNYNTETGKLSYETLVVENGKKTIQATVTGMVYSTMYDDGARFSANNHTFTYNKLCSVGGKAVVKAGDLNQNAKLTEIKNAKTASYSCEVKFDKNIVVNSFSGGINYSIGDITIDPVHIGNLPDVLKESGTNIELENPQLYLSINNPFFDNNITAQAGLRIVGNVPVPESAAGKILTFDKKDNKMALSPKNEDLLPEKTEQGYVHNSFTEMANLLSGVSGDPEKDKIPETLNISIVNPVLNADDVKNFALGVNHPGITGKWEFYTKLSLTEKSTIKYVKEWDDWGSKDLDGLTVEKAIANFTVDKDVAVDAEKIKFTLLGKNGQLTGETPLVGDEEQDISMEMTGGPVSQIYGGKIELILKGQGKPISAEQQLNIKNLRVKVDGYYDRKL